ncbi:hypothetical protein [Cellvibrio fibrivorans]|jgi:hypothetical protein|uniref:Uncharacterized protein n=1 Tax=Cellvibrio fibrivorans TaxID=126350 RepID=A0ABU1V3J3_9GAMM|nr:hypothetical protein [Cellvibrio fibrivorans]MDR7091984.1 hypothetical protein [Cellvibrio fibrivorans]
MSTRLGIYDKWEKGFKKHLKSLLANQVQTDLFVGTLKEYCQTGDFVSSPFKEKPSVSPAWFQWEQSRLNGGLVYLSRIHAKTYELNVLNSQVCNLDCLGNSFLASYFSSLIDIHMYSSFSVRFGRSCDMSLDMKVVPYASIGFLIGAQPQALSFSRLLIKAFHKKWFNYQEYPIFCFMLRILADFLDEKPLELSGKAAQEILFHELFNEWKNPDPDSIAELCLAVCDYHTHQCKPDSGNKWHEFNNGEWVWWPIEINLLFKLRELLGFKNPDINHPLMNTTLGQLPAEKEFVMDDLLLKVLERMQSQGFDENEVFEKIYSEKF